MEKKFKFYLHGEKVAITDQYQYLGVKLRPSGSLKKGVEELNDKASRAWFGISNIVHKNKRMETDKVFGIFDSLVTPVATYGCEFWLPYLISKSGLTSPNNMFGSWETLKCETLNQKCSRRILSVHSKASRLAVLGELGRHPLFIPALSKCINYKLSLEKKRNESPIMDLLLTEMTEMTDKGQDCWLSRVNQICKLLNFPTCLSFGANSGKTITKFIKGRFANYWLMKINEFKANKNDNLDHNKLRVYKSLKLSFDREPYIEAVRNRNQRSSLTRLRISAHCLATELGRRTQPITPFNQRFCAYCNINQNTSEKFIDTELHFLTVCERFSNTRNCVFSKLTRINPSFAQLSNSQKFISLMCPANAQQTKLVNRFIKDMFAKRTLIDNGGNTAEM